MANIRNSAALAPSEAWLEAIRARVKTAGPQRVAKHAKLSRTALWYLVGDDTSSRRAPSVPTMLRVVAALNSLDPADPVPPPYVIVDGPGSKTWKLALKP